MHTHPQQPLQWRRAQRLDRERRTLTEGNGKAPGNEVDCFFKVRSHKADGRAGSWRCDLKRVNYVQRGREVVPDGR